MSVNHHLELLRQAGHEIVDITVDAYAGEYVALDGEVWEVGRVYVRLSENRTWSDSNPFFVFENRTLPEALEQTCRELGLM